MVSGMMLYFDALEEYKELTDEQFGRLIRAGLLYGKTGEDTQLKVPEKYLYPGLKLKISRDRDKYEAICEKRAEAARRRWNQQPEEETTGMQKDANGCKPCQYQYQEKEKEKEKYQYQHQEKEKEKGQRKASARDYSQRDYSEEDEEAMQRMLSGMGKESGS